jgi:hypothetical protein
MQRTALRARKIGAFLKVGISATAVPIYECAAADAQTVGQRLGNAGSIAKLFSSSYTLHLICYNVTTDFYAER